MPASVAAKSSGIPTTPMWRHRPQAVCSTRSKSRRAAEAILHSRTSISRARPCPIKLMAINGKQQRHDSSRNSAGVLRPTAKLPATPEEVEGPVHPLVRIHPETGRRALSSWTPADLAIELHSGYAERPEWKSFSIAFGITRPKRISCGRTIGDRATYCSGTTAARCTSARKWTTRVLASCIALKFRVKPLFPADLH